MCVYHFSVRPPKKSWKNISNLSGGEKTLSSLALVCVSFFSRYIVQVMGALHCSVCIGVCSPPLQTLAPVCYRCLLSTTTNPRPCMLWTRLTLPWTTETYLSLLTISRFCHIMLLSVYAISHHCTHGANGVCLCPICLQCNVTCKSVLWLMILWQILT